jgi:hypothetical protein
MTPDAVALLDLLTNRTLQHRKREVYRADNGSGWYVTYSGGKVNVDAVRELVAGGHIRSVYSDCPNDCYHVGRTLDVARTIEERKKHRRGKDAPKIYVDDPLT